MTERKWKLYSNLLFSIEKNKLLFAVFVHISIWNDARLSRAIVHWLCVRCYAETMYPSVVISAFAVLKTIAFHSRVQMCFCVCEFIMEKEFLFEEWITILYWLSRTRFEPWNFDKQKCQPSFFNMLYCIAGCLAGNSRNCVNVCGLRLKTLPKCCAIGCVVEILIVSMSSTKSTEISSE